MTLKNMLTAGILCAAVLVAHAAETPKVGDKAPAFTAQDQDERTVKLSDFAGKQAVLLYFYPKDQTPGCTKEACGFRDRMEDLKKQDVVVLGVSRDDAASHKKFIAKENLNFSLLADVDGKVTEAYGAGMEGRNYMSRRVSFLIDKNGKVVHVTDTSSADKHLAEMKDAVAKLKG
ncbi:MAG TPA: thioredoxin-dependent thiol peroxidase [Methylomirabilota bacterium]|nr:thioredoxin-dependent thiol peroxidase [Methylomirabilota bacterium]